MSHSSDEDNVLSAAPSLQSNTNKKRRVQNQRACDRCRQKKIRCDGNPLGSKCSHCLSSGSDCIFKESPKTRGPPKRYVDSLETRLEKMEGMLSRLYPDGDFSQEMELDGWARGFQPDSYEDQSASQNTASSSKNISPLHPSLPTPETPSRETPESHDDDFESDSDTETSPQSGLLCHLRNLSISPNARRYFGKSSSVSLLRSAMSVRSKASDGVDLGTRTLRRKDFWQPRPWERDRLRFTKGHYNFPEPDLLISLITIFFTRISPMMPLLHQSTFMKAFNNDLHLRDYKFGALVLLVCATASRYSADPRCLLEGGHLHSTGWKWFIQVEPFSSAVLAGPELYDLQIAALSVMFAHGTLPPHEAWIMVGVGLRLAQDVGAHHRRPHQGLPSIEDELCKRAFWVLLMYDIWTSSYLGRHCAISEENYDVDLPVECDDEYWENDDPALAFKQPPGRPSHVVYFNHLIKINLLHSHALRTIYSLNKYRLVMGPREKGWEEVTVASLNSALNSWFDSVPDHLRWDPQREDMTFFVQSAALRIAYNFIQITIHRPFIPKEGSLSFPALAICASAARACSHIADAWRKRLPHLHSPNIILPTFVAGVILLLSLWAAKRSGTSLDSEREMQDVRKCMKLLEEAESRWCVAGRLRDLLTDLSAAGDLAVPADSPPSNKREREDSDDESTQPSPVPQAQTPQWHGSASMRPAPQPPVLETQADLSPPHTFSWPSAEFISPPTAMPPSSHVHDPAVNHEVGARVFGHPVSPAPPKKVASMLVTQPYSSSYQPLGGSSGLGRMTPVNRSPVPVSPHAAESFGTTAPAPLPGTAAFSTPPSIYGSNNRMVPLSARAGGAPPPGINMMLGPTGPYDFATSTPPLASASISSSSSSPQSSFHPNTDFNSTGAGAGGVPFDMNGMEMEFGGYGVPTADKEAMLRHFAPVLLQDGQIGVDRDTMMMWSTMPSGYEAQDWEAYLSSMLGITPTNPANLGVGVDASRVGRPL
ncbi:fungal-specific transcription factor domain-containing protein [Russula compacta]|nr:fungal-specific transcription factor domain-containing protein [Russula compacta]